MIRPVTESDSAMIVEIYNYYVSNTTATFEGNAVAPAKMAARIHATLNEGLPWLVAEIDGVIIGYAYASKWKGRCAYRYSGESTVYMSNEFGSKGWGSALYEKLLRALTDNKIHVVMGGISLPNSKSIRLHEKFGFEKVAHFKEVGYKFDKWIDVGYWQLKLND